MTTESSQQITKEKNPGRVKAGHRLRAWNLKNKEDLLKNQKQEQGGLTEEPALSGISTSKSQPRSYDVYMIGVGILSIISIALFVYVKMPEKTVKKTTEEPIKKVYKSML